MSISLGNSHVDVVVQVMHDKFSLDEITLGMLPEGLFKWETGGLTDPIGQLVGWLWDSVQSALNIVSSSLQGALWTVRDYLYSAFSSVIGGLSSIISGINSMIMSVYNSVLQFPNTMSSLLVPIQSVISYVGSGIASFGGILSSIWNSLSGLSSSIIGGISGYFSQIQSWLSSSLSVISSSVGNLSTVFTSYISTFSERIGALGTAISSTVTSIIAGVNSSIGSIGTSIANAIGGIQGWFTNIASVLSSSFSGLTNYLTSFGNQLWQSLLSLKDWFGDSIKGIAFELSQLWTGFETWMVQIPQWFQDTWNTINEGLVQFSNTVSGWWQGVQKFFSDSYNNLARSAQETVTTLGGFINPLVTIAVNWPKYVDGILKFINDPWKGLADIAKEVLKAVGIDWEPIGKFFDDVQDFFKDPMKSIGNVFKGVVKWGTDTLFPAIKSGLSTIVTFLTDTGKNLWDGVIGFFKTGFTWMSQGIQDLVNFFTPKSPGIMDQLQTFFADLLGRMFFKPFAAITGKVFDRAQDPSLPKEGAMESTVGYLGGLMLETATMPYMLSAVMRSIGEGYETGFEGGIPKLTARINIRPGLLLKHMAKVVWKMPDIFMNSLAYGYGIWMTQPLLRVINSFQRNKMPIEMPNLQEIRQMANRASVLTNKEEVWKNLTLYMAYYGYSDTNVTWNLGFYNDLAQLKKIDPITTVTDRFGNKVDIELALRHQLPSGSEFATMMVRDVFATFEDFNQAMLLDGFSPDVSKLYYLIHYKYPTLENIWTFISRMAGGFGWATGAFEQPAGLGFTGQTPEDLSKKYSTDPIKGMKDLSQFILPYAKWHDYAPFGWMKEFTSDRLMMIDLMARLPDRIEGRWMYKWSIIDDMQLMKLVVAEGFHPNQIENVAIAEAMNALTEERGSAKTGIVNMFEAGFMTKTMTGERLSQITTVTVLGKERTIKLLEGEKKLELIRSVYDRAKSVLGELWRDITSGFTRNMYAQEQVMEIVIGLTTRVKETLGIDLQVDEAFLNVWLETHRVRQYTDTIQRVRSFMRIFIYRASQLAQAGEDVTALITQYADAARLTPIEREIMLTLSNAFIKAYQRSSSRTALITVITGQLKRGEIDLATAIAKLVAMGMTEDQAKAEIETKSKTRVVSTDKLIAMMEDVPISMDVLKRKMDAEGVPLDEQALYLPYAVAQELKEEMGTVATEYVTDFVGSMTDESTLRTNLDLLATLNNSVKEKLGVDWIVFSPMERDYMIYLAKLRRVRAQMPAAKAKTLSSDKIISMMSDVPVDVGKLVQKMQLEGIPQDEQALMIPYSVSNEIKDEIGKVVTELVTDVANGVYTFVQLEAALNDLATLGGSVPQLLGVPWIVLSPLERQVLINLAKLRRTRVLAKQAGVK